VKQWRRVKNGKILVDTDESSDAIFSDFFESIVVLIRPTKIRPHSVNYQRASENEGQAFESEEEEL